MFLSIHIFSFATGSLEIGDGVTKHFAGLYVTFAKERGIEVTNEQALQVALRQIGGHEYAHVIDRALQYRGIDTKANARTVIEAKYREWPDRQFRHLHSELFARSIQEIITKKAMADILGFSSEQIDEFFNWEHESNNLNGTQSVDAMIAYAKQQGYSMDAIGVMSDEFFNKAKSISIKHPELGISTETDDIWRFDDICCYAEKPYSEEQLKQIVKPSNIER